MVQCEQALSAHELCFARLDLDLFLHQPNAAVVRCASP